MKLLHITYSGAGGMTEAVLTLLEAARKSSSSRHFLLFFGTDELPERIERRCQNLGLDYAFIQKRPGYHWPSLLRILVLLRRLRPDVVYSHMTQPLLALVCHRLARRRCRVISIEHHSNALKSKKDWMLTCANNILADHTIYLTPQYRQEVQHRLGPLFQNGKTTVIPNGVDTERFKPAPADSQPPSFLVGMAARMVAGKDFATLLQAFQMVVHRHPSHQLRLQLAGDGPLRSSLVSLSKELGIGDDVDFLGDLSQDALIPVMRSWQIFVLCTLGETMSRSIMEAQSLGLPIISTRVPGVSSAIENGKTGLLVNPGDPHALAQALQCLFDSSSLRAELGQIARQKALMDYSSTQVWRRYDELSRSLFSN